MYRQAYPYLLSSSSSSPHLKPVEEEREDGRAEEGGEEEEEEEEAEEREEGGLFFCAFTRNLSEIDRALDRMAGVYSEDGTHDNLLTITRAATSNYYYVPSMEELEWLSTFDENNNSNEMTKNSSSNNKVDTANNSQQQDQQSKEYVVFIEYCTNCGYKTIFNEKKKVLEEVAPYIKVIGNPTLPKLAAFGKYPLYSI